jgi:hypothetical protein
MEACPHRQAMPYPYRVDGGKDLEEEYEVVLQFRKEEQESLWCVCEI